MIEDLISKWLLKLEKTLKRTSISLVSLLEEDLLSKMEETEPELVLKRMEKSNELVDIRSRVYSVFQEESVMTGQVSFKKDSISERLEIALVPITDSMNETSLYLNRSVWEKNTNQILEDLLLSKERIREVAGSEFNPKSNSSCEEFFIKRRGLFKFLAPSGGLSFSRDVLTAYANLGDNLASEVLVYRTLASKASQMKSFIPYLEEGLIKPHWDSMGQSHARYTCVKPNLQNRIVELREVIEPPPGKLFVSADWAQCELRVLADLSRDSYMQGLFNSGIDPYQKTGELIKSVVSSPLDTRALGKVVSLSTLYLMKPSTLGKTLNLSGVEVSKIMDSMNKTMPKALTYIKYVVDRALEEDSVQTYFGRVLSSLEGNKHDRSKTAWHFHNSGTAAELLKIKMYYLTMHKELAKLDLQIALNMYDEVIFTVDKDHAEQAALIIKQEMEAPIPGFSSIPTLVKIGSNWREVSK